MKEIHVVVGVLVENEKILIAKRKNYGDGAGLWEFPGGKIEEGESQEECLKRELLEELGINIEVKDFIIYALHENIEKNIHLYAYYAKYIEGIITLEAHDKIKWVSLEELSEYEFPPADIKVIEYILKK